MEAHRYLMNFFCSELQLKLKPNSYCYHQEGGRKVVILEIPKEDYELISFPKKICSEIFVYTKLPKIKENEDTIDVFYSYRKNPNLQYESNIATGNKKYGVIAPNGKFYECGYAGHNDLEYNLKELGLLSEAPSHVRDSFEWFGWVKLTGAAMITVEFVFVEQTTEFDFKTSTDKVLKTNKITKEQIDTICKYIKGLGRELVNFNYRWYNIEDLKLLLDYTEDIYEFSFKYGLREIEKENEELYRENNEQG